MALLVSLNPHAQSAIVTAIVQIQQEHSNRSWESLSRQIQALSERGDLDIVITGFFESRNPRQPEFGLAWFRKGNGASQDRHPLEEPQNAIMVGGLVYHPTSDEWSIHT